jgi:hypothetical protein
MYKVEYNYISGYYVKDYDRDNHYWDRNKGKVIDSTKEPGPYNWFFETEAEAQKIADSLNEPENSKIQTIYTVVVNDEVVLLSLDKPRIVATNVDLAATPQEEMAKP